MIFEIFNEKGLSSYMDHIWFYTGLQLSTQSKIYLISLYVSDAKNEVYNYTISREFTTFCAKQSPSHIAPFFGCKTRFIITWFLMGLQLSVRSEIHPISSYALDTKWDIQLYGYAWVCKFLHKNNLNCSNFYNSNEKSLLNKI